MVQEQILETINGISNWTTCTLGMSMELSKNSG